MLNQINIGISEKYFIKVDSQKIGMFIRGESVNNPVLLYLHGGMPEIFLSDKYPTELDKLFTVVWLEQRGSGISFNARYKDRQVTIEDLINDAVEITKYLQKRFSQKKIYLMAHSGGTYIGVKLIEKHPELYKAYFGISQISNQKMSEKLAYEYMKYQYEKEGDRKKVLTILKKSNLGINLPLPKEYLRVRDYAMHDLGIGTMRQMKNIFSGIFLPSLLFSGYTFREKVELWKGKSTSGVSIIWNEILGHDLSIESIDFKIPVYFLHGVFDYTCSYELAKVYFEKIKAPRKEFYTLSNSAHSPIFEEPNECYSILKTIVTSSLL